VGDCSRGASTPKRTAADTATHSASRAALESGLDQALAYLPGRLARGVCRKAKSACRRSRFPRIMMIVDMSRPLLFGVVRALPAVLLVAISACDKSPGAAQSTAAEAASGAARAASAAPSASAPVASASAPWAVAQRDAGAPFKIVFQLYDRAVTTKTGYRAKLRVKTSDDQTFEYKTPVTHASCYLLKDEATAQAATSIDGDTALLVCAGGAQTDQATVTRKSETLVEVSVFQKAFEAPDTPPAKPVNTQTFSIKVPEGAVLQTTFESDTAAK